MKQPKIDPHLSSQLAQLSRSFLAAQSVEGGEARLETDTMKFIRDYAEIWVKSTGVSPDPEQLNAWIKEVVSASESSEFRVVLSEKLLKLFTAGRGDEAVKLIDAKYKDAANQVSIRQRKAGLRPKGASPINELLREILTREPSLSTDEVIERLRSHIGGGIVDEIDNERVFLCPTEKTTAGGAVEIKHKSIATRDLASRISKIKKKIRHPK
jgi:hypothetical protein